MSAKDQQHSNEAHRYVAPHSGRNPIPTIAKYREEKASRQEWAEGNQTKAPNAGDHQERYQQADISGNNNDDRPASASQRDGSNPEGTDDAQPMHDTSQVDAGASDPKQRRKDMKNRKERAEREVTDPVTHLPITIHDFTDEALENVDVDHQPFGHTKRTSTGPLAKSKTDEDLHDEKKDLQHDHDAMTLLFPPPEFDVLREELVSINKNGMTVGLVGVVVILLGAYTINKMLKIGSLAGFRERSHIFGGSVWILILASSLAAICGHIYLVRDWMTKRISRTYDDQVWEARHRQGIEQKNKHDSESTVWLNSLIGSIWPLVNPDLFTSLADTLEDVMQASLPAFVRMISVDDIGQGSEPMRILGVRWLPTGAAAKKVTEDGSLSNGDEDESPEEQSEKQDTGNEVSNAMDAEEGDFVNLEVAFAYRSRSGSRSMKELTKDMHLYLAFYLPGNIKFPIWVDLHGIIGTMRMRLQLTPDPPFFSLCTMTLIGQPKVNVSCVPLSRRGLNIMDLPIISKFVQSAVDAAMAQYVAPKSLTLDLKDMLAGDDFKKDTVAVGVLVVHIKRGYDFKMGDTSPIPFKDGSADPYVSVGWAKFGKVAWTTRVIGKEMEPCWDETCFILVTPEEINVEEKLRVQLWDSDRMTADDDLGRIEVSLGDLMNNEESKGRMSHREDSFRALKQGEGMPGTLEWSVGYYPKAEMQQSQLDQQTFNKDIRTMEKLRETASETCDRKLREAMLKEDTDEKSKSELEQQKRQELKAMSDAMIISAPPPDDLPSGMLSIQIHNITGLEIERQNKADSPKDVEASDEEEEGEGLPSAYCSVIINHRKTFKTRTKPQNAKPFYNTGCERFIRDWRECEVFVSVRDSRLHEDDPLLGIVHLPLGDVLEKRSQIVGFYPLSGGIGNGRIRISLVWRSVALHLPRPMLGWQYGTLQVHPTAVLVDCPSDLAPSKLKFRTDISTGRMYPGQDGETWSTRRGRSLVLAVQSRYNSCLSIALKNKRLFKDNTSAFCVLWLKDLVDEEEAELELTVWKGDFERATASSLDECGEKLATLKVKVTFWSGMGSAHVGWSNQDENLRNIVEVIEAARNNLEATRVQGEPDSMPDAAAVTSSGSDSSSDSDSDSDDGQDGPKHDGIPDGSSGQKQNPIDQIRDYRRRDRDLHRHHRGIMQWKLTKTNDAI